MERSIALGDDLAAVSLLDVGVVGWDDVRDGWEGVTVSSGMEQVPAPRRSVRESLDEQALRKGLRPVERIEDMAQDGVFDSDEELEAFLAYTYSARHDDMA